MYHQNIIAKWKDAIHFLLFLKTLKKKKKANKLKEKHNLQWKPSQRYFNDTQSVSYLRNVNRLIFQEVSDDSPI